jgi:hypothetical protein
MMSIFAMIGVRDDEYQSLARTLKSQVAVAVPAKDTTPKSVKLATKVTKPVAKPSKAPNKAKRKIKVKLPLKKPIAPKWPKDEPRKGEDWGRHLIARRKWGAEARAWDLAHKNAAKAANKK